MDTDTRTKPTTTEIITGMFEREITVVGAPTRFETSWIIDPQHVTWEGRVDHNQADWLWTEFFGEQRALGNDEITALNKYVMPYNLVVDWASNIIEDETGTYIVVTGRRAMGGFQGPGNSANVAYYVNKLLEIT